VLLLLARITVDNLQLGCILFLICAQGIYAGVIGPVADEGVCYMHVESARVDGP